MEIKIYTNEFGHMAKMAAMSIHDKNLKKFSSPGPCNGWTWYVTLVTRVLPRLLKDDFELTLTFLRQI